MAAETTHPGGIRNLDLFWELVNDSCTAMFLMRGTALINFNRSAEALFGCSRQALFDRFPLGLSPERQPGGELSSQLMQVRKARAQAGAPQSFSWQHFRGDGSLFRVITHLRQIPRALVDGATDYVMVEMYHASEEQKLRQLHIDTEDYLDVSREMIEGANDAMLLVENDLIVECNPAACELYGLPRDKLLLSNPIELSPDRQPDGASSAEGASALMQKAMQGEPQRFVWQHLRAAGSTFIVEVALNPARNLKHPDRGQRKCYVAIVRDITENYRAQEQLRGLNQRLEQRNREVEELLARAHQDPLLQIPTLVRFIELLSEEQLDKSGKCLAIVDIDEFSAINGALGHEFGDVVLKAVSERLARELPGCVIARLGSDVFGIMGPADLVNPATLHGAFSDTFLASGERLRLSATIGLVRLEEHPEYGSELIKDAHVALKRAKNTARGSSVYYSEPMGEEARKRVELLNGLREALHGDQLFLMYQPKVHLHDASPSGFEALLRWRLPSGSMIPPDQFIPLAEQSGLIIPIGTMVLKTACHYLAELRKQGYRELVMAINVSQMQLREPDFLAILEETLDESGVPPEKVELEVTESIAADDLKRITHSLNQIMERGVRIAIDDFGTGFSSLSVLTQLPANRLKIDRSFINDILQDDRIARMVINLGQSLNLDITAEGVETARQCETLIGLQCGEAQGWYFARPMEGRACLEWLNSR
ncbi:MAG: bifunctional diguanylate cyclase/phosphodiesterase [Pseudomonadota bacterium]|nr:bifunctional diguanylate cyclase/phosphodiesterase [Pseudomonadota bacterium]